MINDNFDIKTIQDRAAKHDIKLIEIQRSKGYSTRKSLTIDKIEKVIKAIREVNKDVIIMVDNCYGEFVEEKEPTEVGADIIVGFNEEFRSWNCNEWSIYCGKERFN